MHDAIDRGNHRRARERRRLLVHQGVEHAHRRRPIECRATREHLIEHRGERKQIRSRVDCVARSAFRRHVTRSPEHDALAGERQERSLRILDRDAGDAKVEELCAVLGEKDVRRLQIAMQHAASMQRAERVKHVERNVDGIPNGKGTASDPCRQRLAVEQFHGDEQLAVMLADFVQLTNIRMTDACRGTRLAPQPFTCLLVGELGTHGLERDRAPQAWVLGGIDHAHATFAKLVQNAVSAEVFSHQVICSGGNDDHNSLEPGDVDGAAGSSGPRYFRVDASCDAGHSQREIGCASRPNRADARMTVSCRKRSDCNVASANARQPAALALAQSLRAGRASGDLSAFATTARSARFSTLAERRPRRRRVARHVTLRQLARPSANLRKPALRYCGRGLPADPLCLARGFRKPGAEGERHRPDVNHVAVGQRVLRTELACRPRRCRSCCSDPPASCGAARRRHGCARDDARRRTRRARSRMPGSRPMRLSPSASVNVRSFQTSQHRVAAGRRSVVGRGTSATSPQNA